MQTAKYIIARSGVPIVITLILIPLILWYPTAAKSLSLRSVGQLTAISGAGLLAINFILSTRLKIIEKFFQGLNKVYIYHHIIGAVSFTLLLLHPVFIGLFYLQLSLRSAFDIIFPPISEIATWFGMAALLTMIVFLVLTLFVKLPYDIWKLTHKFMGIALVLAAVHILLIDSTVKTNLPLRYYLLGLFGLGLISYLYKTIFGSLFVKKLKYKVSGVTVMGDIIEVALDPLGKKLTYDPGQFIFIKFKNIGITREEHPFSLISAPDDPDIKIGIKAVGNYTETLKLLKSGAEAEIEGAFGSFTYLTKRNSQIWIAGGIGVTPFVSMANNLKDKVVFDIYLFYVVSTRAEAIYLTALNLLSRKSPLFKVIPVYTKEEGRLTAERVSAFVPDYRHRDILICGPLPMMKGLRKQFNKLRLKNSRIFTEEFTLD